MLTVLFTFIAIRKCVAITNTDPHQPIIDNSEISDSNFNTNKNKLFQVAKTNENGQNISYIHADIFQLLKILKREKVHTTAHRKIINGEKKDKNLTKF